MDKKSSNVELALTSLRTKHPEKFSQCLYRGLVHFLSFNLASFSLDRLLKSKRLEIIFQNRVNQ